MTTSFRLIALSIAALGLASCQSSKTNADPYASNAAGGGYNPYPDSTGGYASNSASAPTYQSPPASASTSAPAPHYDPYAYTAPKTTPSHSSSAPKSTAKKKTTASTSTKKKSSSSSSKRHTVKQGETLYGIARSNHTTVAKLKSTNGISSDIIRPGQTLKIP